MLELARQAVRQWRRLPRLAVLVTAVGQSVLALIHEHQERGEILSLVTLGLLVVTAAVPGCSAARRGSRAVC